jgi:aldehyde dehydrogenase (NAD+)
MISDKRLSLISFTGSSSIGTTLSSTVHSRFGRTILSLGGNNSVVVMDDADFNAAINGVCIGATSMTG